MTEIVPSKNLKDVIFLFLATWKLGLNQDKQGLVQRAQERGGKIDFSEQTGQ